MICQYLLRSQAAAQVKLGLRSLWAMDLRSLWPFSPEVCKTGWAGKSGGGWAAAEMETLLVKFYLYITHTCIQYYTFFCCTRLQRFAQVQKWVFAFLDDSS